MFWSKLFIPTLRTDPAGADSASRRLMMRGGYLRKSGHLYLGQRSISKITSILRDEMNALDAQELIVTGSIPPIASELQSYKQLPQIWYQVRGLLMESCSFELTDECPARFPDVFRRIFDRCGLAAPAAPEISNEPSIADPEGDLKPEEFHTPGQKTIADIAAFTGLPETSQMKSVVMAADGEPVLAMLRGDHTLSEARLRLYISAVELRPARAGEIREWFGADAGSLGPVGVKDMIVLADTALAGRRNMICGANRNDYHLRNVTPGENFQADFVELREVGGEGSALAMVGSRFVGRSGPSVTNPTGELQPLGRRTCHLYIDRALEALVEQHQDRDGIALPPSVAPFTAIVTPVNFAEPTQHEAARKVYDALNEKGVDTLLDDRDERPGVKFKDADLVGVPYRITIGKKLSQGLVEVVNRRTHESSDVRIEEAAAVIAAQIK